MTFFNSSVDITVTSFYHVLVLTDINLNAIKQRGYKMMMKSIAVTRLHSNPDRDFKRNPLDEQRVLNLVDSIQRNDFWHGIIVRPYGDDYQMAFGHHRIEAAKRCGITEVEVDVADLSDNQMCQYLSAENWNQGGRSPAAAMESITAAKRKLDTYLRESDTSEEFCEKAEIDASAGRRINLDNPQTWSRTKASGSVGKDIIRAYLGDGWSNTELSAGAAVVEAEYAADRLKAEVKQAVESGDAEKAEFVAEKINTAEQEVAYRDIIEMFPRMENATVYVRELKKRDKAGKPLPKSDQIAFATRLINNGTGKRDIPRVLTELVDGKAAWAKQEKARLKKQKQQKASAKKNWKDEWKRRHSTTPDEYIRDHLGVFTQLKVFLEELAPVIDYVEDQDTLNTFLKEAANLRDELNAYTAGLGADTFKEVN